MESKFINKPLRGQNFLDIELSNRVFKDVIDVLNENDVHYFLDYGTLLGFVREGEFVKRDFDIDITILSNSFSDLKKIYNTLKQLDKKGLRFGRAFLKHNGIDILRKANIIVNDKNGNFTKLELSIGYIVKDKIYKVTGVEGGELFGAPTPADMIDLITVWWKDRYVKIPKNPEVALEYHYGDWKTPRDDVSSTYKKPFEKINI